MKVLKSIHFSMTSMDKVATVEHQVQEAVVEQKETVNKLYHEFGDNTTLHGMRRAVGSDQCWKRCVWTMLVLGGASLALYQFISIIQDFQRNPVSTVVSIEYEPRLEFPAVTLCNLNPIRLSKASNALKEKSEEEENLDVHNTKLEELLSQNNTEEKKVMGHAMQDMLIECKFNGTPCTYHDFKYIYNQKYVNCYTFGYYNNSEDHKRYTTKTGPANGLIIEMDIQQYDYLPLTQSAGVKVLLHPDTEAPFPEDGGLVVGPGFVTSIAARRVESRRQPFPQGSCVSLSDNIAYSTIFSSYGYTYTDNACKKSCYQKKVFRSCNCCDIDYPCVKQILQEDDSMVELGDNISNIFICNSSNTESMKCVSQVEKSFWTDDMGCANQCPPACDQIRYSTVVSMGVWPSNKFMAHFRHKINGTSEYKNTSSEYIQNNFLKLQIYYEVLNYVLIETNPAYDWNKLLSDIGGQLGLWLGCSLLTALEVIQFGLEITVFIFRKICRSRQAVANYEGNDKIN
ncbi:hypothetical protein Btru_034517 [Bulinus truncatus]|nr:hypothetical protein Btru_034517 [Bulinus truncatus]